MTILTTPADAGADARGHLWPDLSRKLRRLHTVPVRPPVRRSGSAGGPALVEVAS